MSRSKKDDYTENPATRFFDWSGGTGELVYYDREAKENVAVPLPFRFLVLDEVATVGGGYDDGDTFIGYWSNAIRPRDAKVSPFTVKSSSNGKSRTEMTGVWADVKGNLTGAKYIKGLYIGFFGETGLELGYLKIRGAAMSPWMELVKEHKDIYAGAFAITGKVPKKKGTNNYFEPAISFTENVKEETNEAALALDRDVLQPYLTVYFAQQGQAVAATAGGTPSHTGDGPEMPRSSDDEPPSSFAELDDDFAF
jgi:hypothetical protein